MKTNDDRTFWERIADRVASFGGSWKFIFFFSFTVLIWLIVNTIEVLEPLAFDKSPYMILNLALGFMAVFMAPFILMSQTRAEKKQDEAYRFLFTEIKELVQSNIEEEHRIQEIMEEIRADHREMKERLDKIIEPE